MTETTRQHLMTFWRLVEEILNALLFLMIGLEIAAIDLEAPEHHRDGSHDSDGARHPLAQRRRSALPLNLHLPHRYGSLLILTWGGLRGGLSVAMALSLPDGPNKASILTIAYGIVVFSIVVQGLTLEPVARRLCRGGPTGNRGRILPSLYLRYFDGLAAIWICYALIDHSRAMIGRSHVTFAGMLMRGLRGLHPGQANRRPALFILEVSAALLSVLAFRDGILGGSAASLRNTLRELDCGQPCWQLHAASRSRG